MRYTTTTKSKSYSLFLFLTAPTSNNPSIDANEATTEKWAVEKCIVMRKVLTSGVAALDG